MSPLSWKCLAPGCEASGKTDAGAAKHTKDTLHGTLTVVTA